MNRFFRVGIIITFFLTTILIIANIAIPIYEARHWDSDAAYMQAQKYNVEIIRDEYGVPHIYGKRDIDVAFGLAYAHAQDDFKTMQDIIPFTRGELGRVQGFDALPIDYLVNWLDIRGTITKKYETALSPKLRAYMQAYADGLNYYAAQHPDEANALYFPVKAEDLVTNSSLLHLLFFGIDDHLKDLLADKPRYEMAQSAHENAAMQMVGSGGLPTGSNAFAINPTKSLEGATRLVINSHQPLTGPVAWYEAHLKSEEGLDMHGGTFPLLPLIALGFNPDLGWGITVSKPDLVDIYKLTINPDNENEYLLDGIYMPFERRFIWLKMKLLGNLYLPIPREVLYSAHGPAIRTKHGVYALRASGMKEIRHIEQWMAMNKARNLKDWKKAMAMQYVASFNFVYADRDKHIYFLHNTRSPRRMAGWDWAQYLPGTRSDLIWHETISFNEMPQLTDPPSGYIISANQSPFHVTAPADNLSRADYAEELGLQTRMTNRAMRGLFLFADAGKLSKDAFTAIKWDKAYHKQSRAMQYVAGVYALPYPPQTVYAEGQVLLANWTMETTKDNRAAALGVCLLSEEWLAERAQRDPPPIKPLYEKCITDLLHNHGRIDPLWSDVNRLIHGAVDLPLGGGPDVMRAVYALSMDDGRLNAVAGDGLTIVVHWDENGEQSAEIIHNYGAASTRPDSLHYSDQAPLFAAEKMRPIALTRKDVLSKPHKVLHLP